MRKTHQRLDKFIDRLEQKYQEKLRTPERLSFSQSLASIWRTVAGQEDDIDKIARQIVDFSGYKPTNRAH